MSNNATKESVRNRGYFCAYCGKTFFNRECTIDHIIPRSKGGSNHFANLVACCQECNYLKGDCEWIIPKFCTTNGYRLTPAEKKQRVEWAKKCSPKYPLQTSRADEQKTPL